MNQPDFKGYLQFEKRFSQHTVTAYLKDLEQFELFLEKQFDGVPLFKVENYHVRSWVVSLVEAEVSARSVSRKISSLKTFYRMLLKEGAIQSNPASNISIPKVKKRLPVFLDKESSSSLFSEFEFPEGYKGARDKIILELFYTTGMRLAELIGLTDSSVDFKKGTVRVLGKRNKERIIPLLDGTLSMIQEYLNLRNAEFGSQKEVGLILTDKGKNLYPKFVYRLVNNYLSKVTTLAKKSPHVLRHNFATHMLNNGAELNAIKELLGHASLSATQVYTHNTIDKLKQVHSQAHPLG